MRLAVSPTVDATASLLNAAVKPYSCPAVMYGFANGFCSKGVGQEHPTPKALKCKQMGFYQSAMSSHAEAEASYAVYYEALTKAL